MKTVDMYIAWIMCLILVLGCGSSEPDSSKPEAQFEILPPKLEFSAAGTTENIRVASSVKWSVVSNETWCTCSPENGYVGETNLKVTVLKNTTDKARSAILTFTFDSYTKTCDVNQEPGKEENYVPEGYKLVWQDEFTDKALSMPDESLWWYEVWGPGYVNNELQRYVKGKQGNDVTAEVSGGTLKIHARKVGNEVISARVNTIESWKYGYFEARLKLPKGKGTWPAFWMMPKQDSKWPDCGEIDIMEEVGYNPNYVSSSIHSKSYNHVINTQKTKETLVSTAQTEFHVYALEWTEDFIRTYIDGKELFYFANDKAGNNDTWPFNAAFYLKLNLAWGGDWGGAQGVDESVLPATYEIDYVRVFQKK